MTTSTIVSPVENFRAMVGRYKPENSADLTEDILEEMPFCLVERCVEDGSFWFSFHETEQDAAEYCADMESADGWVPHEMINVYSGAAYRPRRTFSFAPAL